MRNLHSANLRVLLLRSVVSPNLCKMSYRPSAWTDATVDEILKKAMEDHALTYRLDNGTIVISAAPRLIPADTD